MKHPSAAESVAIDIAKTVASAGGRALMVGGCVRDGLTGTGTSDIDIEVFGIPAGRLETLIARDHPFDHCGVSFGVLKLKDVDIDVSLPRRESKTGPGHRAFAVSSDPFMTVEEASLRRDFTINSLYKDPLTGEIIDPNGGMSDLENRILRHVSGKFAEDPLRVLRGAQFVARFDLCADPATIAICRSITPENLAPERVFGEWKKLLLKGRVISKGLEFLRQTGWVSYYPELSRLIGCRQDPKWHPEGDVWEHTKCCLDHFAGTRTGDEKEDLIVGLAVLCHDFGKPACTRFDPVKGRLRSLGHDEEGVPPATEFLSRMTNDADILKSVPPLVRCHMRPFAMWKSKAGDSSIRRLSCQVGRIDRLIRVAAADDAGRPPFPSQREPLDWLSSEAHRLDVQANAPRALLMGRDLIAAGMKPGPGFKALLDKAYEAQLEGAFTDHPGALDWLASERGGCHSVRCS